MAGPASVAVGWRSEAGRRRANEDAVLDERLPDGRRLVAVADGMGGHQAGEIASRTALDALRAAVVGGASLRAAIAAANRAVHQAAVVNPELDGMGTTLVAALCNGVRYEVANVGDSRAYIVHGGSARQITADHSFLAEAIAGGMPEAEALRSRWRNALTRSIGTEPEVEVDVFGPYDATSPHALVLCSDGLHGSVPGDALGPLAAAAPDPQALATRLAGAAYENGSTDNISVAVVRFEGVVAPRPARGRRPLILMGPPRRTWRTRLRRVLAGLYARSA